MATYPGSWISSIAMNDNLLQFLENGQIWSPMAIHRGGEILDEREASGAVELDWLGPQEQRTQMGLWGLGQLELSLYS